MDFIVLRFSALEDKNRSSACIFEKMRYNICRSSLIAGMEEMENIDRLFHGLKRRHGMSRRQL